MTYNAAVIDGHLLRAVERLSELLASLRADDHVSPGAMLDHVREAAAEVLTHVWKAPWEMPILPATTPTNEPFGESVELSDSEIDPTDPQKVTVADWRGEAQGAT